MKLFSAELRQLFNVRFLLVVALASIVYAYSLLTFSNESLETYLSPPDGSTTSNTEIEKHRADSVLGDGRLSVTEEDLDVLSEEMTKTEELDAFFRNTEAFRQYGVSSLEDYKKLEKSGTTPISRKPATLRMIPRSLRCRNGMNKFGISSPLPERTLKSTNGYLTKK